MWAWMTATLVVTGLVAVSGWLVRSHLRDRRRARYLARLSARYQSARPALPAASEPQPPSQKVTVDELVARLETEGLPACSQPGEQGGDGSSPSGDQTVIRRGHAESGRG
jgi:hypothetical protein